jgi:hypothetical protein
MEGLAPLARELGLHVSLVEPGPVNTEFVSNTRALSAELLSSPAPGYEKLIVNYAAATGNVFAEHGQTGDDIAALIGEILSSDAPHLRYLTSDFARETVAPKFADPTGDAVVERFAERLRGQG